MNNIRKYDYRVAQKNDNTLCKSIYVLCECHYDTEGEIKNVCIIDDMTSYSRADAIDFLLKMSGATMKPVINMQGKEVEDPLIEPSIALLGNAGVVGAIGASKRRSSIKGKVVRDEKV